jgi:hypothetical protein
LRGAFAGLRARCGERLSVAGRRRRGYQVGVLVFLAATIGGALHQTLWSYRYARADPWSELSPVQWILPSGHVRRLDGLAERVRSRLPEGAALAVSPDPALGGQGFYQFLWLAYVWPENDLRLVARPEDGLAAGHWLVFGDQPLPAERLERIYATTGAVLYRVREAAQER